MGNSKLNDKWNKAYFSLKSLPKKECGCYKPDKIGHADICIRKQVLSNDTPLKEESCTCHCHDGRCNCPGACMDKIGCKHCKGECQPKPSNECTCTVGSMLTRILCPVHASKDVWETIDEETAQMMSEIPSNKLHYKKNEFDEFIKDAEIIEKAASESPKSKQNSEINTDVPKGGESKESWKLDDLNFYLPEHDSDRCRYNPLVRKFVCKCKMLERIEEDKQYIRDLLLKQREGDIQMIESKRKTNSEKLLVTQNHGITEYNQAIDDILKGLKKG